jgi:hypothetical protein
MIVGSASGRDDNGWRRSATLQSVLRFQIHQSRPQRPLASVQRGCARGGFGNAALKIATQRLVELTSAIWVDVCR